jgi:hypothetical protein
MESKKVSRRKIMNGKDMPLDNGSCEHFSTDIPNARASIQQ